MAFEPGNSGNKKGRPKGALNKGTNSIRERLSQLVEAEFATIQSDFQGMKPHQRIRYFIELLPYLTPKMKETSLEAQIERLPDEQLDEIINKLAGNQKPNQ